MFSQLETLLTINNNTESERERKYRHKSRLEIYSKQLSHYNAFVAHSLTLFCQMTHGTCQMDHDDIYLFIYFFSPNFKKD
jgi:hypothetical protein